MISNLHLPIPCLSVCVYVCARMHLHSQACMRVRVYKCIHTCGGQWSTSPCFRDRVSRWPRTHKAVWLAIDSRDLPSWCHWCCDHKRVPPPLEFSQGFGEVKLRTSQLSERTSLTKPSHKFLTASATLDTTRDCHHLSTGRRPQAHTCPASSSFLSSPFSYFPRKKPKHSKLSPRKDSQLI